MEVREFGKKNSRKIVLIPGNMMSRRQFELVMVFSILMILGVGIVSIWDGFRSGFAFRQFFLRFVLIFTIYKLYDMIFFDYFLLCKYRFFQYYYPEVEEVYQNRKYGFNIKSQLLKLLVLFPAASALAAWLCALFMG